MKRIKCGALAICIASAFTVQAAPNYTLTLIEGMTEAIAINNSGDVVGTFFDVGGPFNSTAVSYSLQSGLRAIAGPAPAADSTIKSSWAYAINNAGNVLTSYSEVRLDDNGNSIYSYFSQVRNLSGSSLVFDVPGGGWQLNNSNYVVLDNNTGVAGPGFSFQLDKSLLRPPERFIGIYALNDSNILGGEVWEDPVAPNSIGRSLPAVWLSPTSAPTYLDLGGFRNGYVSALNNAGVGVGGLGNDLNYNIDSGPDNARAALWDGQTLTLLPLGNFSGATAENINERGDVIGSAANLAGAFEPQAVLWRDGEIIDLNDYLSAEKIADGWSLTYALDINDEGWIVGSAYNAQRQEQRGFLLSVSAVPEPSRWMLLLSGLGLIFLSHPKRTFASRIRYTG